MPRKNNKKKATRAKGGAEAALAVKPPEPPRRAKHIRKKADAAASSICAASVQALSGMEKLQAELRQRPAVRVGPSSLGPRAGDGVFAARCLKKGDTVTWSEQLDRGEAWLAQWTERIPYTVNHFEYIEKYSSYEMSDARQRDPKLGPVGHIVNDAGCIEAVSWDDESKKMRDGHGEVLNYLRDTAARENVQAINVGDEVVEGVPMLSGVKLHKIHRIVALRDIDEGEELFRTYGVPYWMRLAPVELSMLYMMQFCRVDLRIVANMLSNEQQVDKFREVGFFQAPGLLEQDVTFWHSVAALLRAHAETLFESCSRRLNVLEDEHVENIDLFKQTQPHHPHTPFRQLFGRHRSFDGYFVHLWIQAPAELRREFAKTLKVYEPPFLPTQLFDKSFLNAGTTVRTILQFLHNQDQKIFTATAFQYATPIDKAHSAEANAFLQSQKDYFAFGRDPHVPW